MPAVNWSMRDLDPYVMSSSGCDCLKLNEMITREHGATVAEQGV
jgi:hypothetical protein